jgi:hypothetical protein
MKQQLKYLLAAMTLVGVCISGSAQESANPFIGTWDIDFEASHFGSAVPPRNLSRTYSDHGDGTYTYIVVTTAQDGTLTATSAHYDYSGEEFPIASFEQLSEARISYRKESETTVEYTITLAGEVQQIGAKFISPNYQRLTISIQYPNSDQENQILVFDRRT